MKTWRVIVTDDVQDDLDNTVYNRPSRTRRSSSCCMQADEPALQGTSDILVYFTGKAVPF